MGMLGSYRHSSGSRTAGVRCAASQFLLCSSIWRSNIISTTKRSMTRRARSGTFAGPGTRRMSPCFIKVLMTRVLERQVCPMACSRTLKCCGLPMRGRPVRQYVRRAHWSDCLTTWLLPSARVTATSRIRLRSSWTAPSSRRRGLSRGLWARAYILRLAEHFAVLYRTMLTACVLPSVSYLLRRMEMTLLHSHRLSSTSTESPRGLCGFANRRRHSESAWLGTAHPCRCMSSSSPPPLPRRNGLRLTMLLSP